MSQLRLTHVTYQEVVSEEFWQLQADDVIVQRKQVESPFISGHICERPKTS